MTASAKRNITRELNTAPDLATMQPLTRGYYENLQSRYNYLSRSITSLTPRQFKTYERIAHGEGDLEKKRQTFYGNIQTMLEQITYGLPADIANKLKTSLSKLSMQQLTDLVDKNPYLNAILDWYEVIKSGGRPSGQDEEGNEITYESMVESLTQYVNAL